jgi:hypothetical protein
LQQAENGQEDRTPNANRSVARQECHKKGGNAHQYQSDNERRLAAHAVAEMAEDKGTDRARDKADEIDGE